MTGEQETVLSKVIRLLTDHLGENLYSCCLYGSAVRGNLIEGVSDINLLIVLNDSIPEAHEQIASALKGMAQVDPFILGRAGFERSVKTFAAKFSSIQRNYRVLYGADPLGAIVIAPDLERFLCEQALRNLRLRLVYFYVQRANHGHYVRFLMRSVTPLFLRLSEILRLEGHSVPLDFEERILLFERELGLSSEVLRDLLKAKNSGEVPAENEATTWHVRIFPVLDVTLNWVESHWADNQPGA